MNKLIGRILLAMALAGVGGVGAQAQTRVATVDGKKVTYGYWKTKEAKAALNDRREDLLKELKGLSDDIKKGEEEYKKLLDDANDQAVSDQEREKRKKAAEAKLKSIREITDRAVQFDKNAKAGLDEMAERMSLQIDKKIHEVVSAQAKSAGYAIVLDTAGNGIEKKPIVLYANDDNDLTQKVIELLNIDAPADAAKSSAPAEEKKTPKK